MTHRSMSSRNTWISPGNSFRMLYSASESCFGLNAGMYVIRTSVSSFVAPEVSVSSKLASDEDNKGSVVCWATYGCTVLSDVWTNSHQLR